MGARVPASATSKCPAPAASKRWAIGAQAGTTRPTSLARKARSNSLNALDKSKLRTPQSGCACSCPE
eukprot:4987594-Pyramimonas_sp.AAC.1